MKHLLVINVFFSPRSYGGATVVAEELARRVAADGDWQVSVLSFSDYGTLEKPAMIRTRLPEGLDHYTINLGGPRSRDLAFDNLAVTAMAADLIGRLRPDAAHVHCAAPAKSWVGGACPPTRKVISDQTSWGAQAIATSSTSKTRS